MEEGLVRLSHNMKDRFVFVGFALRVPEIRTSRYTIKLQICVKERMVYYLSLPDGHMEIEKHFTNK